MVSRTNKAFPPRLKDSADEADNMEPAAITLLTGLLVGIDLYGKDGLKARSNLFEYRYDPIQTIS